MELDVLSNNVLRIILHSVIWWIHTYLLFFLCKSFPWFPYVRSKDLTSQGEKHSSIFTVFRERRRVYDKDSSSAFCLSILQQTLLLKYKILSCVDRSVIHCTVVSPPCLVDPTSLNTLSMWETEGMLCTYVGHF